MGVEKLTAHFNPVLDNVGGGKAAGWGWRNSRARRSSLVGGELSGAFERRRRVRREKTGKQQSTHGAGTAAV